MINNALQIGGKGLINLTNVTRGQENQIQITIPQNPSASNIILWKGGSVPLKYAQVWTKTDTTYTILYYLDGTGTTTTSLNYLWLKNV